MDIVEVVVVSFALVLLFDSRIKNFFLKDWISNLLLLPFSIVFVCVLVVVLDE